jgi:hypothetical protein
LTDHVVPAMYRSRAAATTNHLAKMIPDPGFINLDDLAHRLQSHRLINQQGPTVKVGST